MDVVAEPKAGISAQAAAIAEKEFLPEDGSADWVTQRRERFRASLIDVASPLANRFLANEQPALAAQVSGAGLAADRYVDALWRILIDARERAGDEAGARRAQAEYRKVVLELERETIRS